MYFGFYFICEIISVYFMYLATKARKNEVNIKYKKVSVKISSLYFLISLLPFAILFFVRGINVGTDYKAYSKMYLKIINNTLYNHEISWLGYGFINFCKLLSFFFGNKYYLAYALINIITLYLFIKTIYDVSEKPVISLWLFYSFCLHFQIFNQFRQMLAISIVFFAIRYLSNRDFKKYCIAVFIASLFHTTALIMIPVYWISNSRITTKKIALYIMVSIISFFAFDIIVELLKDTYYGRAYFGGGFDIETMSSKLNFIVRLIMIVFCLLVYNKVIEAYPSSKFLYNMAIFCTIIQIFAMKSYIFARLTTYFFVFYVLLIPYVCNCIKIKYNSKNAIYYILCFVLIMYQTVYYFSSSGASGGGYEKFEIRNSSDVEEIR